jgi:hypothetical protein
MASLNRRSAGFALSDEDSDLSDEAPSPTRSTREMFARSSPPPAGAGEMEESVYARRPFVMPAETDVMAMREEERSLKASTRARLKNLSVRDKTTFSSRAGSSMRTARLEAERVLHGDGDDGLVTLRGTMRGGAVFASATTKGAFDESAKDVGHDAFLGGPGSLSGISESDAPSGAAGHPTKRPESVADFVAKKREIFLVQMSLDAKRAEILKLEREAARREEALAAAEATLVEDARRFDEFLKENDLRVQQAIRAGEAEARLKNDKAAEIKRLAADIVVAEAALSKREEKREDCERYKAFLDGLTPVEFFEAQDEKRRSRRAARRAARQAKRDAHAALIADADAKHKAIPSFEAALAEAARRGRTAENAAREKLEAAKADAAAARGAIPERAPPGTPPNDDSGEETPMYFVSPSTLPEVFSRLEETNLFLMQNGQEAEAALEEMKAQQRAVRTSMERDADALHAQIETLKTLIAAEEEEAAELRGRDVEDEKNARRRAKMEKRSKGSGVSAPISTTKAKPPSSGAEVSAGTSRGEKPRVDSAAAGAGIPLELLAKKVGETYARCGFDYDPTMSTVQMLTQIESKLERCLAVADEMPAAYVRESEKAREKERRFKQRSEKAAIDLIAAEEKAKRSLERSMAPVVRKVGKPLMTRSQPPSRKKKVVKEQLTEEEAELRAFLATEF